LGYVSLDENTDNADQPMALWGAMTLLVCALFFILPARALVRAVTYPAVQKEDRQCVNFFSVAIWAYTLLYVVRALWNLTHFFDINPLQELVYQYPWRAPGVRAFNALFILLFDITPASLAIAGVYLLRKHDMLFNETTHFAAKLL
jgi:hypothetical protein